MHADPSCNLLTSAWKDGDIRIWDCLRWVWVRVSGIVFVFGFLGYELSLPSGIWWGTGVSECDLWRSERSGRKKRGEGVELFCRGFFHQDQS